MIHKDFYATAADLLPKLRQLESEFQLQYALEGMYASPTPSVYRSATEIPGLGIARYGQSEDAFLVSEAGLKINVEEIPQTKGGVLYHIGLIQNPTAFAFKPSGQFGEMTLICGSVDTATGDPISLARCKWFWRGLRKDFVKLKDYYLGPEAYQLLKQGWRLTVAAQCPPEFDLTL